MIAAHYDNNPSFLTAELYSITYVNLRLPWRQTGLADETPVILLK